MAKKLSRFVLSMLPDILGVIVVVVVEGASLDAEVGGALAAGDLLQLKVGVLIVVEHEARGVKLGRDGDVVATAVLPAGGRLLLLLLFLGHASLGGRAGGCGGWRRWRCRRGCRRSRWRGRRWGAGSFCHLPHGSVGFN